MRKLVLFGCSEIGQLAHFYFSTDSAYEVAAFTVDAAFVKEPSFCGLPVVPFEEVERLYPPAQFEMFVALSYNQLNELRARKVAEAAAKGYALASYLSSRATVLTREPIGRNCFLLEDNTVQPFVRIGANVTLWSGNHIGHHSTIGDDCFISSHVVVCGYSEIGESCFVGVNSSIADRVKVARDCVIGAGTTIARDTEPAKVYKGERVGPSKVSSLTLFKVKEAA
jgi:sugar O-acyltransferase (sialic acid O-acetyltransferase NeuD family)